MNVATMIDRAYDGLRDAGREFITPEEVLSWLNEAQLDLAMRLSHRLGVLHEEVVDVVPAEQTIPLPADFLSLRDLRLGDADVSWRDAQEWWDAKDSLVTNPYGGPFGRRWGNAIEVYPQPAVGAAYEFRYIRKPPDLVDAGPDSVLPQDLHVKMVHFARALGFKRLNEMEQAGTEMDFYERGLPAPTPGQEVIPMPMSLRYQPNRFDRDREASHRG